MLGIHLAETVQTPQNSFKILNTLPDKILIISEIWFTVTFLSLSIDNLFRPSKLFDFFSVESLLNLKCLIQR